MSSLRNAIPRKAHKERAQPLSKRNFGLLEKHKDYVERARVYHKKEQTLQKLKEKATFRNPDEFYFKMIKSKTVNGVHREEGEANKYSKEELMLMKTQDIGYILQKLQAEKKDFVVEIFSVTLQTNTYTMLKTGLKQEKCEQRFLNIKKTTLLETCLEVKKKTAASYRELETRKGRVQELEKIYMGMSMQREMQKKGRKRKLHEDEIVSPTSQPVFKW